MMKIPGSLSSRSNESSIPTSSQDDGRGRPTDSSSCFWAIANLDNADGEFTILELVEKTKVLLDKGFSSSHASQMLLTLTNRGLIYKHRFGKYSFAVPLMAKFIRRNYDGPTVG